jgi:hypothetical protein
MIGASQCAPAMADNILDINVLVQWGRGTWNSAEHEGSVRVTPNGDGTYDVHFYGYVPGEWGAMWNFTVGQTAARSPDLFLYGLFIFTNASPSTGTFSVGAILPGVSAAAPTQLSGSVSGTLLDRNGNGATVRAPGGGSFYTAMIDGVPQKTLLDAPFSSASGPYMVNAFGPAAFSGQSGPAVTQGLAIVHYFSLRAHHDSITVSSSFVVTPEPAALVLLAVGLAGTVVLRRRA